MRIVHIITRLILGGAQENTVFTVEGLQRDFGDRVTLITGPPLGLEGSLLERAYAGGLDVRVVPELRRAIHPWLDLRSLDILTHLIRELQPEVVHTHSSKAGILGRAAAARLGVPLVVHTVHGPPFHTYQSRAAYRLFVAAERWAARRTMAFISVCDTMTDHMVAAGVAPRERFTTIYSGMETESFLRPPRTRDDVRRELGYAPSDVVITTIARLAPLKGHDDVIEAARRLISRTPAARFLFVGGGALVDQHRHHVERLGLADRFTFLGMVPADRIPELLHASDIVVHPSLREGLARVLPQALIAGRPVVSYNIDGAHEVVLPGITGVLLQPRDVAGLADALNRLASDPEARDRMGSEGRRRFTEQFSVRRMVEQVRALYVRQRDALSGR